MWAQAISGYRNLKGRLRKLENYGVSIEHANVHSEQLIRRGNAEIFSVFFGILPARIFTTF